MSYPMDLDEYADNALTKEMDRRYKARDSGVCDYCKQPPGSPVCKVGISRHTHPAIDEGIRRKAAEEYRKQDYRDGMRMMTDRIKAWIVANPEGDPAGDVNLDNACNAAMPGFSGGMWISAEKQAREELAHTNTPAKGDDEEG